MNIELDFFHQHIADGVEWILCPEYESSPETHDEDLCPYGCFEDTIPCPCCQRGEDAPTFGAHFEELFVPYEEEEEHENDWIDSAFAEWVEEQHLQTGRKP